MSKISVTTPYPAAESVRRTRVIFIGGARYTQPLGITSAKKFRSLQTLVEPFVIGFSQDLRPRWLGSSQGAQLEVYTLPSLLDAIQQR